MVGKTKEVQATVRREMLACEMGSGELEVLATPAMVALMEQAADRLLAEELEEGETSVGTMMNLVHTAPTPLGMQVRAKAAIIRQEGRKVEFEVTAYDECGEIGRGEHARVIVKAQKFQRKANDKLEERK